MIYTLCKILWFQDITSKWWYPATITNLCVQPKSYNITARDDVTYRKNTSSLEALPTSAQKKTEDKHSDCDMQTSKANHKQFDNTRSKNNQVQSCQDQRDTLILPIQVDL